MRGRDALWQHDRTPLDAPAAEHDARVHVHFLCDLVDQRVVDGPGLAGLVVAERRVGFQHDVVVVAVVEQVGLGEVRVGLDLVARGHDVGFRQQVLEAADVEV